MLLAFEGIDGSGKSTQADLLFTWLAKALGFGHSPGALRPFLTKWNSSPVVKHATKHGKKARTLTPTTFALLEAADLADRYDREIKPILEGGCTVIADRWAYTAFARGMARGLDAAWLRGIYSFAPKPDLCFYLALPADVALARILKTRALKHYEAGLDVTEVEDPDESFLEFQGHAIAAYNGMQLAEKPFIVIDAQTSIEDQHEAITLAVQNFKAV
jgi:dTMP kinase